eukprot:4452757-Ditylum_brightwellii.AAC.1
MHQNDDAMMPGISNDNLRIESFAYHACYPVEPFLGTDGKACHEQCWKGSGIHKYKRVETRALPSPNDVEVGDTITICIVSVDTNKGQVAITMRSEAAEAEAKAAPSSGGGGHHSECPQ